MKRLKAAGIPLLIVIAGIAITVLLTRLPFFTTLEHKTIDWRIRYRKPDAAFGRNVLVVFIDEAALAPYPCRSPVPREMLADLIKRLARSGADVIGLDVLLKDPTTPTADQRLAETIAESGNVVLVQALRDSPDGGMVVDAPRQMFLRHARGAGLADLPIDPMDQRVRQIQPAYQVDGRAIPSFSKMLASCRSVDTQCIAGAKTADGPASSLSEKNGERFFIDYQAPPAATGAEQRVIPSFPASIVTAGMIPADWIQGKIVLIGAGYEDNTDVYRTPFYCSATRYALTPGVEIHANALATLLAGKTIRTVSLTAMAAILAVFGLLLLGIDGRLHPAATPAVLIFCLGTYLTASFLVFEKGSLALPVVPVFLSTALVFAGVSVYRSLTEGRQKRWIKGAFQKYLSPEFVEMLVKRPDLLNLGGEERELTILFSDLQGFTSLSETMEPKELFSFLNTYLDGMTRILLNHGGTLDKYEGDAIMAFWGAPVSQEDHADRAVSAALEMAAFSDEISHRFTASGKPSVKTRIGINTGPVMVGNVGSKNRFNYTIIGDAVNLASRLEGANKQYGTYLMISESTKTLLENPPPLRELDVIRVKGKNRPVRVFQVFDRESGKETQQEKEALASYNDGLEQYRKQQWDSALACFEKALKKNPDDGPSRTYANRCRQLKASPPPEDWDGVFEMKTK